MKRFGKVLLKSAILYTFAMYIAAINIVKEKQKTDAQIDSIVAEHNAAKERFDTIIKDLGAM